MEQSVIFTVYGYNVKNFLGNKIYLDNTKPVAIVAERDEYVGKAFYELPIISRKQFKKGRYAITCAKFFIGTDIPNEVADIVRFLTEECGIDNSKIFDYRLAGKNLLMKAMEKNQNSPDPEIRNILASWAKSMQINIYGTYNPHDYGNEWHEVKHDRDGFPYVMFEGKKMFYPKNYWRIRKDAAGRETIYDILLEQHEHSPHLYIDDDFTTVDKIRGGVLVDAGVCEGNFALRYADEARKIYLLEPDPEWQEPLRRTFSPYMDKVVFCDKFLSANDTAKTITLDTLLKGEKIDFLKMDIEGAEVDALLGAKHTLYKSDAQVAVCGYHRQNDAENISMLLQVYGYETAHSEGYMFFIYDENIAYTLDFRRGIVYGRKKQKNRL